MLQWFEGTGSGVVVLQQQSVGINATKQTAADPFVATFGQPPTALVTTSNVKPEGNIVKARHHSIVELDTQGKPLVEAPAEPFVETASTGIE